MGRLDDGFIKQRVFVDLFKQNERSFNYVERTLIYSSHSLNHGKRLNILTLVQDGCVKYQSMIKNEIRWRISQEANLEGERYRMDIV